MSCVFFGICISCSDYPSWASPSASQLLLWKASFQIRSVDSIPYLLLISQLCILGFSRAIFLLWALDHNMKGFMGRLIYSSPVAVWRVVGRLILGDSGVSRSHHAATRRKSTSSGEIALFYEIARPKKIFLMSIKAFSLSEISEYFHNTITGDLNSLSIHSRLFSESRFFYILNSELNDVLILISLNISLFKLKTIAYKQQICLVNYTSARFQKQLC